MRRNKKKSRVLKDTLIIIGNGFDKWQGLNTGYWDFRDYYLAHRDEILRKLRIKKKKFWDECGNCIPVSDVELVYGDPFVPKELDDDFWGSFEMSLDKIDAERINLFFGKDRRGLRQMRKSIHNAKRILQEAFCRWIATVDITPKDTPYAFGENCLFLNFNYTDTLQKRFGVKEENEFHVHGEADDPKSIVVGHANHPHLPEGMLYRLGGRFRGLFFVERLLYETDKHVQDNIRLLCMYLATHAVMADHIKQIFVLGHSMSPPDIEYFIFLANATRMHADEETDEENWAGEDLDPLEEMQLRLEYAIQKGGYGAEEEEIESAFRDAVERQFTREMEERNQILENDFLKMMKKALKGNKDAPRITPTARTQDAKWYISCYSDRDKLWAETVMKEMGCKEYEIFSTIEDCLKPFQKSSAATDSKVI